MNIALTLASLLSAVISAVVSHFITQRIIQWVSARTDQKPNFLTPPPGSAVLFAVVFVVVWIVVNLILVLPWFLRKHRPGSA